MSAESQTEFELGKSVVARRPPSAKVNKASPHKTKPMASPKAAKKPEAHSQEKSSKVVLHSLLKDIQRLASKELAEKTDNVDQWKKNFNQLATIERSSDLSILILLTMIWLAEHIVDALLRRIRINLLHQSPETMAVDLGQISAFREHSRLNMGQLARHPDSELSMSKPSQPLD